MKYLILEMICILLVSCGKDFLNTKPTDQLDRETALSTPENIYAALNGMHRKMVAQYLGNQACGGEPSICIIRDCMGEDLVHPNTSNTFYLTTMRWVEHRSESSVIDKFPFMFYYYLILQSNLVLEATDHVQADFTQAALLTGIKGEALCFRAWAHFQLVQLYGKRFQEGTENSQPGVPYRRNSLSVPMARHTVKECYTFIHEDLDKAIEYLVDYKPLSVAHFSLKVAYGLKARVFLTQQDYPKAAEFAGLAIDKALSEKFYLMKQDEYLNGFSRIISEAREALWASNTLDDQTIAFFSFYAYMSWNFNSTSIRLTPRCINSSLYKNISLTDVRAKWWDPTGKADVPASSYKKAPYQNRKFEVANTTISAGDFAYMRLSELYLIKAEALARSHQEPEARKVLYDFVSTRDAAYQLSTRIGDALIDEIITHRRIELWGEGFRFTDLKRLNLPLDRNNSNHLSPIVSVMQVKAGDARWQWLIPRDEINTSLGLVTQNE